MTDRELLKEARELIVAMVDWNKAMLKIVGHIPDTGFQSAEGLLSRIDEHLADTTLADHSPDAGNMVAMEIVRKIRQDGNYNDAYSTKEPANTFNLLDSEAAALIESYGRRVPRAMLDEIWLNGYKCQQGKKNTDMAEISAKYGVKIEEAEE